MWFPAALVVLAFGCHGSPRPPPPPAAPEFLTIEWKATDKPDTGGIPVDVSVIVDGKEIPIGELQAASDGGAQGAASCRVTNTKPTSVDFVCGGTPAYNAYGVELRGKELVIYEVTGVDEFTSAEVKRVPIRAATSLKVR